MNELILIALDESPSLSLFSRAFSAVGYKTVNAQNMAGVEKVMQESQPALVLLGESLGKEKGTELVKSLLSTYPTLPIVFLATKKSPELIREALRSGVSAYLEPPLKTDEIVDAVQSSLQRAKRMGDWVRQEVTHTTASLEKRVSELEVLLAIGRDITGTFDLDRVLKNVVSAAVKLTNAEEGSLLLLDEVSNELYMRAGHNFEDGFVRSFRLPVSDTLAGQVIETGEPLIIDDYQAWAGGLSEYPQIYATIAAPLTIGDRLIGVFTTVSTDPEHRFGPSDLHLLNLFGQQVSIAIENARLYDEAQREIAERKKGEAEIVRQKEYFEALFTNNPVAVVTADLDGIIVSWNPMAEKLFKHQAAEVIGKHLDDVVGNNASIRKEALRYTKEVIRKGRVQAITRRTTKDGSLVDVELLALPVIVAGQEVGFISIYAFLLVLCVAPPRLTATTAAPIFPENA